MLVQKCLYVYIIQCRDESYYTGVTNYLKKRYVCHEEGSDPRAYTYSRRPFKVLYWEIWDSPAEAIAREKQIKRWSRAKKKALVEGDIEELMRLSNNKK